MNFEEFIKKYQKKDVQEYPNSVSNNPTISVFIVTYNHVNFISECLEGILKQETEFSFEIIIGEDESTDGTREICIEYAKKYPEKIRLFLHHRENNIKINGNPTGRFNYLYTWFQARGKYIAICDGDDYWTDENKLQKQVGFLEENSDYSLSFHRTAVQNVDHIIDKQPPSSKTTFICKDLILNLPVPRRALSVVYRKSALPDWFPAEWVISKTPGMDLTVCILATLNHKVKYFKETMGVYRIHSGGIWSAAPAIEKIERHQKYRNFLVTNVFHHFSEIRKWLLQSIDILEFEKAEYLLRNGEIQKAKNISENLNFSELMSIIQPRPLFTIIKFKLNILKNRIFNS